MADTRLKQPIEISISQYLISLRKIGAVLLVVKVELLNTCTLHGYTY